MKLKKINYTLTSIVGALAIGACLSVVPASAQTSIVAHWTFDTASLATDGSGNITNVADSTGNHNMSPGVSIGSGGTGYPFTSAAFPGSDSISGVFGQGLMFNGNNFMMFTNLTELMASSGAPSYTISFWVNVAASIPTGNGNHQFGSATPYESFADWGNAAATTGKSRYVYCFGPGGATSEISHARYLNGANGTDIYGRTVTTSTINNGNWHMVSWSFDTSSGVLKSYFDGALVDTYTSTTSSFILANAASVFGTFGLKGDNGYMIPSGFKIDEAWVFTGVLSSNQIAGLYSNNNINPRVKTWQGSVDNNWDINTANWVYNSLSTNIYSGESALFDDTASTNNVNLTTLLTPWSVTVSNNALAYAFNGSGSLDTTSYVLNYGLIKQGAGTLTLANAGTNKFSQVNVASGALVVAGGSTLALGTSGFVTNNAQLVVSNATLDVSGAVVCAGSGSMVVLGGAFNLGQIQAGVGSLALTNSGLMFKASQSNTNITVAGVLAAGGTTNLVNITSVPASASYPIQFPVIKYGSAAAGLVDGGNNLTTLGVSLPSLGGSAGYLTNDVAGNSIDLVLTSGPGPIVPITWSGQTNGVNIDSWDILVTTNWSDFGQPYYFQNGSDVTFDDSLLGTGNVNLMTTLSPASVTFNNFTASYMLAGTGKLSGSTGLNVNGAGLVVLDNSGANDFSGGVTINSGTFQVGNGDANGGLPAGANVTNNSALVFKRSDGALSLTGIVSGSGSVTNNGTGTVTLNGVQAYSGATVVNAGTLAITAPNQGNSGIGSSVGLTINSGGTFQVNSDNALSGTATAMPVTVNAGGILTGLSTANAGVGTSSHIHGSLSLNGGTLAMGGTQVQLAYGTWDLDGGVTVNGGTAMSTITASNVIPSQTLGTIFTIYNGGTPSGIDLLVSGTLINGTSQHDTGIALVGLGGGVMALDNNNTYTAGTTITSGTLQAGTTGDTAPLATPLGMGGVDIYGGAFLKLASSQGVTIGNVITDSGTLMAVNGTNILTGANTFSGNTVVSGGKLVLSGVGALNSSASIVVSDATLDVSGMSGTFNNPNSLSLTNGTLNLGTNLATTLSSLSVSNSTLILPVNLNTPNVNLTGALVTGGTTNIINITSVPGFSVYPTNIVVIKYVSADPNLVDGGNHLTSLGVTFSALGSPAGYLTNDLANSSIDLVLVGGPPAVVPITWTGETNSVNLADWDVLNNTNWVTSSGGAPYPYQNGSDVKFDDTAPGATTVNLTAALTPASVTVTNGSKNYTFSGNGYIGGVASLTKQGTGTLTLDNTGTNTFSGAMTIGAGTMQVGNNDANGSLGSGVVTNNAVLVFKRTDTALVVNNIIAGTGTIANNGSGTVILGGNNPMSGGVTVNSGKVQINSVGGGNSALGTGNATVNSGATLVGGGGDAFGYPSGFNAPLNIIINGGTVTDLGAANYRVTLPNLTFANAGTLTCNPTNAGDANGNYSFLGDGTNATVTVNASSMTATINANGISMQKPTTFNVDSGTTPSGVDLLVSSPILAFGVQPLIKNGTGTMVLSGTNTYAGSTVINGGLLALTGSATLGGGTYAGLITNNGTLYYNSSAQTTLSGVMSGTGPLIKDNTGTLVLNAANTFTAAITVSNGTLRANNFGAFNGNPITETADGTTVYHNAAGTYTGNYNIIGYGGVEGDNTSHLGAIRMAANGITLSGTITLTGDAGITARGATTTGDTISGQITGNHAIRFNRTSATNSAGSGVITLSNPANNWTGNTTNADGTLKLGASGVIPSGSGYGNFIMTTKGAGFVLNGSIAPTVFDLNGFNQTFNSLSSDPNVTGSDLALLVVTNGGASASTLTVGATDASGNYGGSIQGSVNLTKIGLGTMVLGGSSTYTGNTVVSNGTLIINGSLGSTAVTVSNAAALYGNGSVANNVLANGIFSPGNGPGAIGTFTGTIGTISLAGTTVMEINMTNSPATNDLLVANTLFFGGILTVTNTGPALVAGDSFHLFTANLSSGNFGSTNLPTLGGGLYWTNNAPGTWSVVSPSSVNLTPTNIVTTVSGGQIILSWPSDHTGWYLQVQTNALNDGLGTNWVTIPGSNLGNSYTNTVDASQGAVFYRMVSP